jgi:hypothetical protein
MTWFTVRHMKRVAIVLLTLDIILLLIWLGGAIFLLTQLGVAPCFESQLVIHFLILIHFALGTYLSNMVGEISREERRFAVKYPQQCLLRLPYHFYLPLSWIFIGIVSFVGDLILMVGGILLYQIRGGQDECQTTRLTHIIFDAVAVAISIVTILWFLFFSFYTIRSEPVQKQSALC